MRSHDAIAIVSFHRPKGTILQFWGNSWILTSRCKLQVEAGKVGFTLVLQLISTGGCLSVCRSKSQQQPASPPNIENSDSSSSRETVIAAAMQQNILSNNLMIIQEPRCLFTKVTSNQKALRVICLRKWGKRPATKFSNLLFFFQVACLQKLHQTIRSTVI